MGFGVWGLGVGVWSLGFEVWGLGFGVWGLGFGVWGLGFGVWDLRLGVNGLAPRARGFWEGYSESRKCSRDTYPESYITKYASILLCVPCARRRRGPGAPGYESGYGYCLTPYGTSYGRALRTTRTRFCTRARLTPWPLKGYLARDLHQVSKQPETDRSIVSMRDYTGQQS